MYDYCQLVIKIKIKKIKCHFTFLKSKDPIALYKCKFFQLLLQKYHFSYIIILIINIDHFF